MYLDKYDLSGRTAFVTGGGRGIGLASAAALIEAGAKVVISDIDPRCSRGQGRTRCHGHAVDTVVLDVADPAAVARAAAEANARHGAVDILSPMPASPGPTPAARI